MSATARTPLVRAGPGVSAWTALPERDRALPTWLVEGDVVTDSRVSALAIRQGVSHPTVALILALIGDIRVSRVTMGGTKVRVPGAACTKADSLRFPRPGPSG